MGKQKISHLMVGVATAILWLHTSVLGEAAEDKPVDDTAILRGMKNMNDPEVRSEPLPRPQAAQSRAAKPDEVIEALCNKLKEAGAKPEFCK
jgi:hypothetical protein